MKYYGCEKCEFSKRDIDEQPCASCSVMIGEFGTDNFQLRPKRKELQAQLDTASAELESMHTERAALQAIIDEQEKEIDELRRGNLRLTRLYEWGKV